MTVEAFTSIVPPPRNPTDPGKDRDWTEVEKLLGTTLPTEYKEYIALYGIGLLGDRLWVYNPFSTFRDLNLLVQVEALLDAWRQTRAEFGEEECPYPLYPESGGLLPLGVLDDGSQLFWQTRGDPDQWTVVINESRSPRFQQFEESMINFLVDLFSGRLKSDILPRSLQRRKKRVSFTPLQELTTPG